MKATEYQTVLTAVSRKENLSQRTAREFLLDFFDGRISAVQISAFLTALAMKGETADEVLGFIEAMQSRMKTISHGRMVIDTCGTGGDGKGTFNISTATALLTAACGVKVAKHGNKASSSKCGSADVLEALGVNIHLSPEQAEKLLEETGMVFLFAPNYHPALKPLALIRKELGFRTVFNVLGPFLNPARVRRQLIGVPNKKIARMLAVVATKLKYDHLMIVSNDEEIDEISLSVPTKVYEVRGSEQRSFTIHPEELGFEAVSLAALGGDTPKQNAKIIRDIFAGKPGHPREIVVLNTAYALLVADHVQKPKDGVELASRMLDSGEAEAFLKRFITASSQV